MALAADNPIGAALEALAAAPNLARCLFVDFGATRLIRRRA